VKSANSARVALAAAVVVFLACSSDTRGTNPTTDPFTGDYVLSTVGGSSLPRHLDTNLVSGAFDVLRSGALSFPDAGHIVVSSTIDRYDSATAPAVTEARVDTYTLGRLPTQAFLIPSGSTGDTVASIIVPAANQLALNYRGPNGIGTYLFLRH